MSNDGYASNLTSQFQHNMKHEQYEHAISEIANLTNILHANNYLDKEISLKTQTYINDTISDLYYKSINVPNFIYKTNNRTISYLQEEIELKENIQIPADVIKPAYISEMIRRILGIFESDNINCTRGVACAQKMLVTILDVVDSIQTEKNIDEKKIRDIVRNRYEDDIFIPADAKVEKLGYTMNGKIIEYPNLNKNVKMYKFEKGDCEARCNGENSQLCKNKTENGKICCSEHQPLTQEERRIRFESKTSESKTSDNQNNIIDNIFDYIPIKCKYIKPGGSPCKNDVTVGKFCNKCHKKHNEESSRQKSNDYCTIINPTGPNKGRACGKESSIPGVHICTTHAPPKNIMKCGHVNEKGVTCEVNVKNALTTRCGRHINSVSMVHCEPEPVKKSEELIEWELEQEKIRNRPIEYCTAKCKNGSTCSRKAIYRSVLTSKPVCTKHDELHEKEKNKPETHKCAAKFKTGNPCTKNIPIDEFYCGTHLDYIPEEQCGAFDINTFDRCTKNCVPGEHFCKRHEKYEADPIADEVDVAIIRGQLQRQQLFTLLSQYTVVCVDPPKKTLKLKIVSDEEYSKIQLANKRPLKLKIVNDGNYGLDCFVSNSEESDGTEKSEEIAATEVEPKKPWSLDSDEFNLINQATGWTEEQIKVMKNKRIFKRILGPKKKFDLDKTLFRARKELELYFTRAINDTNAKYNGSKAILSNLIKATFFDLADSVENIISLFGVQKFLARQRALPDCKDVIKRLRNLVKNHNDKLEGLPVPATKKQLTKMDVDKYIAAFEDVKNTLSKEIKEDVKYIKEFQTFMDGPTKKSKHNYENERTEKRKEFNKKYIKYFERYIVKFAKVALHTENLKGRMFGFANYFIDLLNKRPFDYTRFRNAYGGELINEEGERVFYCDIYSIITKIINENAGTKTKDGIMDYLEVDISFNLSTSEHQTRLSEELRECKRTGIPRYGTESMLDVGEVQRFKATEGFYNSTYDYDRIYDNEMAKQDIKTFIRNSSSDTGNYLAIMAARDNYPKYNLPVDNTVPKIKRKVYINGFIVPEEDEFKPSFSNNGREILRMDI